jgi:uncharacterized protein YicC (UPF0701 family)
VDETRLLTEMAILLEKGDIHEELDRLDIHIDKFRFKTLTVFLFKNAHKRLQLLN